MAITQGPWRFDEQSGTVTARSQEFVCATNNRDDARLIAAAPDLLEACKNALEHFRKHQHQLDPHYNAFMQAITKAEGKPP